MFFLWLCSEHFGVKLHGSVKWAQFIISFPHRSRPVFAANYSQRSPTKTTFQRQIAIDVNLNGQSFWFFTPYRFTRGGYGIISVHPFVCLSVWSHSSETTGWIFLIPDMICFIGDIKVKTPLYTLSHCCGTYSMLRKD